MQRHREASLRAAMPALPALLWAAALLALAGVAAMLAQQAAYPGAFAALALVCSVVASAIAGARWGRQRDHQALHDVRQQQTLLGQMSPVWHWQTDARHRLVRLQPPSGAPASSWVAGAFSGECLWQRFDDAAHSMQARMAAQSPLHVLAVAPAGRLAAAGAGHDFAGPQWHLRGMPLLDWRGNFVGYLGTAWPSAPDPVPPQPIAAGNASAVDTGVDMRVDDSAAQARALADEYAAFSYTISHDLRAPIRVVDGFARILKEDYASALDRIGVDHLDRVLAAAARMNSMIDALLSLSSLSTQPLARETVDLSRIATQVAEELHRATPQRLVNLRIQAGLTAMGDPTLLHLVLENLLGNAWKYSAKVALAESAFEQVDQDGRAVYVVRDNGAGFDMRFASRLFGVFARLHGNSEFAGHGVGLASVRRIVRRHGGEIWADAEPGHGARFYFTLNL